MDFAHSQLSRRSWVEIEANQRAGDSMIAVVLMIAALKIQFVVFDLTRLIVVVRRMMVVTRDLFAILQAYSKPNTKGGAETEAIDLWLAKTQPSKA